MKRRRWFMYTVMVGLLPIILRLIIYLIAKDGCELLINGIDFIFFGLVINLTNINEVNSIKKRSFQVKKTFLSLRSTPDKKKYFWKIGTITVCNKFESKDRETIIGLSILNIIILSAVLGMIYANQQTHSESLNEVTTLWIPIVLSFVSLCHGYSVMSKLNFA